MCLYKYIHIHISNNVFIFVWYGDRLGLKNFLHRVYILNLQSEGLGSHPSFSIFQSTSLVVPYRPCGSYCCSTRHGGVTGEECALCTLCGGIVSVQNFGISLRLLSFRLKSLPRLVVVAPRDL